MDYLLLCFRGLLWCRVSGMFQFYTENVSFCMTVVCVPETLTRFLIIDIFVSFICFFFSLFFFLKVKGLFVLFCFVLFVYFFVVCFFLFFFRLAFISHVSFNLLFYLVAFVDIDQTFSFTFDHLFFILKKNLLVLCLVIFYFKHGSSCPPSPPPPHTPSHPTPKQAMYGSFMSLLLFLSLCSCFLLVS